VTNRLPQWASVLHSTVWLRLLDARDLDDITMNLYSSRVGAGFDGVKHNLSPLWPWEENAFRQFLPLHANVLVAGAGGGREMIALAKAGHEVIGFDASNDLVVACRENLRRAGVSATIMDAAPGQVPSGLGVHDALVIGRGVYHHIPHRNRRMDFLRACRAHIETGSPLFVGDFLTRAEEQRSSRPVRFERGDLVGSAFFHKFTRDEIVAELDQSGFDLVEFRVTPFEDGGGLAHAIARARD